MESESQQKRLFWLCFIAYSTSYLGRQNFSAALTDMIGSSTITAGAGGNIGMAFFLIYGAGQLISGMLADKLNPQRMIVYGLATSAILNCAMACVSSSIPMMLIWALNGFALAMIWPPVIRIFASAFSPQLRARASINITSTLPIGTLGSYLLSALALQLVGWRLAFVLPALIMAGSAILFYMGTRSFHIARVTIRDVAPGSAAGSNARTHSSPLSVLMVAGGGMLMVMLPDMLHGVLKDGLTTWVPTYISDTFSVAPSVSVLITLVLPIVNLTGAYAGGWVNRKLGGKELLTSSIFFVISALALLGLLLVGSSSIVLCTAMFAITTSSMLAVNTMLVNVLPLRFTARGCASSVSGMLNAVAYLGAGLSTSLTGILATGGDYRVPVASWLAISAIAAILAVFAQRRASKYVWGGATLD